MRKLIAQPIRFITTFFVVFSFVTDMIAQFFFSLSDWIEGPNYQKFLEYRFVVVKMMENKKPKPMMGFDNYSDVETAIHEFRLSARLSETFHVYDKTTYAALVHRHQG